MKRTLWSLILLTSCLSLFQRRDATDFYSKINNMVESLAAKIAKKDSVLLFVPPVVSTEKRATQLSNILAEELSIAFVDHGIKVVERTRLREILSEMNLEESGLFDIETTSKIGKLLGANYIVLGSYSQIGNEITVNLKFVELERGVTVAAQKGYFLESDIPPALIATKLSGAYYVNGRIDENTCSFGAALPPVQGTTWKIYEQSGQTYLDTDKHKEIRLLPTSGRYTGSYDEPVEVYENPFLFLGDRRRCAYIRKHVFKIVPEGENFKASLTHEYVDTTEGKWPTEISTCPKDLTPMPCRVVFQITGGLLAETPRTDPVPAVSR